MLLSCWGCLPVMAALCMCCLGKILLWPPQLFSAIPLMHFSPRGRREVRKKKHDSPFSALPAFGSISVAPFPSSQPLPSCLSLNSFWSPRCRLETRLPGAQMTPQFKQCQSVCFHLLLSSPFPPPLTCLSVCLPVFLPLLFLLSARRWGLSDGGFSAKACPCQLSCPSLWQQSVFSRVEKPQSKNIWERNREWVSERGRKKEKVSAYDWVWCMCMRVFWFLP